MSGLNPIDRLKAQGLDVKKASRPDVAVGEIWFPPERHPLHHPRGDDPLDDRMVEDIVVWGVLEPILVRRDGPDPATGKQRLLIVDGARRTKHAIRAEQVRYERGLLPQKGVEHIYAQVEFFTGTDAELLLERVRRNNREHQKPDSPSVLARTFVQLERLGVGARDIVAVAPRGVGAAEVAALLRWGDALPEVRARFDSGDAPLALLTTVLDGPREEQSATLDRLLSGGASNGRQAVRVLRGESARGPVRPKSKRPQVRMLKALCQDGGAHEYVAEARRYLEEQVPIREDCGLVALGLLAGVELALRGELPEEVLGVLPTELRASVGQLLATTAPAAAGKIVGDEPPSDFDAPTPEDSVDESVAA